MRKRHDSLTRQVIHLLGDPSLTHDAIARSLGISTKTVQRVAKEAQPELKEADTKVATYQRLLGKKLPIEERVNLMHRIARRADTNPFAAMRALERADALDGIVTAKDQIGREKGQLSQPPVLFALPPGTNIRMQIGLPPVEDLSVVAERQVIPVESVVTLASEDEE